MIKFEKRYNGQGEVAVLYSPGYGAGQLCVEWIRIGDQFRINEYDGFETIEINANVDWDVA